MSKVPKNSNLLQKYRTQKTENASKVHYNDDQKSQKLPKKIAIFTKQKTEKDRLLKFNTKVYNNMMKNQNNISKSTFRRSKKSKSYLQIRYNIDQKNINNYPKT